MTTQANETNIIIPKWKIDELLEEAEEMLKSAGKTVGSTIMAADYPCGVEERDYAVKDAARCYNEVQYFIEQMKIDFDRAKEVVV